MIEPAVVALRLLQYTGAMVVLWSSLFFVYARQGPGADLTAPPPWARAILLATGGLLAVTSFLQIAAHAIQLSGSFEEGLKFETLSAVVSYMDQGKAAVVRAAASTAAVLVLALLSPRRIGLVIVACLGAVATLSLVWMGHAAATEGALGTVHRVSDGLHLLAAAVWMGALVAFFGLLLSAPRTTEARADLHAALAGFAGIGSAVVAVLILTGAINSWILVGLDRIESLWTTSYGRLLGFKVLLFLIMLGLAASNRYRLTPALERSLGSSWHPVSEMSALRRSVAVETALGIAVLLLVAWFGTLAPPAAG